MLFFLCTTAIASFVGLIIPRLICLGKGVSFKMATSDIQATKMDSILDTIKGLIPSNPVSAFAEGNMLQVLVFALIMGFTLIAIGEKGEPLLKVIDSCNEACLKIISTVMYFTPIGVFCTICIYRIWRRSEHSRQDKSGEVLQGDHAGGTECIWYMLKFSYHSAE